MFFGVSALQLRSKIDKKRVPRPSRNQVQKLSASWCKFWSIWKPTWVDFWVGFGGQVGPKLEPNGNKPDPTTNEKYDHFWEGLRKGFWQVFGPNLGPTWTILASRGRLIPDLWGCWRSGPGRPLYPSRPKTPPRPPQDTPRHPKNLTQTFKNASTIIPRCSNNSPKSLPEAVTNDV